MSVSYMAIVAYTKGKLSTPAASPFGLSFGPTVITASRYNESGLVEVTEQTTSTEYQQLFQAAVQDFGVTYHDTQYEGPKHEQAKMVFTGSSQSMTRQLKSQLGYEPEFAALIHATVMQGWLSHAAQTAIFGLHAPPTVTYGGSQKAAVQIVDFLQCEHLNRSLEECSSRGPENSLLFLEYQDDYLYAWFYDVDFEQDFYAHYYREICKDCGERFREVSHTYSITPLLANLRLSAMAFRYMMSD